MNIKKYGLKTMCAALACTTVLSSTLAAYATEAIVTEAPMDDPTVTDSGDSGWTTEENSFEDIKVTYQQSSSYTVTIPKTIALGTNKQAVYSVKVSGEIGSNQRVYVAPVDGIADSEDIDFHMSDLSGKKADVVATVTQNKVYWSSENVANAYEETQNCVSAPDLSAGTWEGTFQVEIRLETEKAHEHNYVDGKCECGAIDPNHTHNYENGTCTICGETDPNHTHNYVDGTCTICGKEQDPYEIAPATAYSKWNYTLDDTNNIITLNYYTGSETDVIVYANYVIGGKTYKTQLKSNSYKSTTSEPYMFNGKAQANCKKIKSIVFSDCIDTSNVTDMHYMFAECTSLTNLDVCNFDTSNVTEMSCMFFNCLSLTSLDLSNFDTSNVTNMSGLFQWCNGLTNLNLSSFNTSNVTNMGSMFLSCTSLPSLDLSSFDTSKVTDMSYTFNNCPVLNLIYVTEGKWSTSQAKTTSMFDRCGTSSVTYK